MIGKIKDKLRQRQAVPPRRRALFEMEAGKQYKAVKPFTWYRYQSGGCCRGVKTKVGGRVEPGTTLTCVQVKHPVRGYPNGQLYVCRDGNGSIIHLSISNTACLQLL